MKIAIVAPSPIPFLVGGAEKLFAGLFYNLLRHTSHQVELIKVPVHDQEFWSLMDGYQRAGKIDLGYFDMVISTKYPVWLVDHPNHHVYMQHTSRGVYDLYHLSGKAVGLDGLSEERPLRDLLNLLGEEPTREILPTLFRELFRLRKMGLPDKYFEFPGPLTRAVVRFVDSIALSPRYIRSYSAISETVANREGYFPKDVPVRVIHHPTSLEGLHSDGYEYIFTASRLEGLKRIDLLINAFMQTDLPIDFRLAGTGGAAEHLKRLARSDKRIKFLGFISDTQLIKEYAGSLFVPFVPYDEDYGLITLEAMLSEKAVLTIHNSGGPSELVQDGVNGRSVDPTVEALSKAITEMVKDRQHTIEMGKKAKKSVEHINWEDFVRLVLSDKEETSPGRPREGGSRTYVRKQKPEGGEKILIPSTFPVYPALGGGQKRILNIAKGLSQRSDVVILSFSRSPQFEISEIGTALREIRVPRSQEQEDLFRELEDRFGQPAEDVALIEGYRENPTFLDVLQNELKDTDTVVCCHPYLYDAVRDKGIPHVYDAHNVEYDLKRYVLGDSDAAQPWLREVLEVEKACAQNADAILSVSNEDRARLCELYGVREDMIAVVPNGADLDVAQRYNLSPGKRKKLKKRIGIENPSTVFVGSYHKPNVAALSEIVTIAKARGGIDFFIVGSVCDSLMEEVPDNVILLGVLPEPEKAVVLNMSDLALNPVIHGGGSNLKLLEYVAYGLPTITTPYGKRGYDFEPEHLFSGDISEFPTLIDKALSTSKKKLAAMTDGAYRCVRENYSWKAIIGKSLPSFPRRPKD